MDKAHVLYGKDPVTRYLALFGNNPTPFAVAVGKSYSLTFTEITDDACFFAD